MLQTQYITLDEFQEYYPEINVMADFGTQENALAFLKRIENRMETFIAANFHKNIEREFSRFNDFQRKHYKLALLEQCIYIYKNSDITVDSGYDIDKGVVANIETIKKLSIAPNAKQELILCGLWSRHIGGCNGSDVLDWIL